MPGSGVHIKLTGAPYSRGEHRVGQCWDATKGKIGFQAARSPCIGGVRSYDRRECGGSCTPDIAELALVQLMPAFCAR